MFYLVPTVGNVRTRLVSRQTRAQKITEACLMPAPAGLTGGLHELSGSLGGQFCN